MAKNQLLRPLMLLGSMACLLLPAAFASAGAAGLTEQDLIPKISAADRVWAEELTAKTMADFSQGMREKAKEYMDQLPMESVGELLNPRPRLQIFASSSMPKPLLADYAKQASIYGGALVFRGLPGGSMIKLQLLVQEISDQDYPAAMTIDDEAFELFGVKQVPTIVLTRQPGVMGVFEQKQGASIAYDKITGNVSVKYALEQFEDSGELAEEAASYLRQEEQEGSSK